MNYRIGPLASSECQTRPRCHQVLPFYDTGRWQLAVFDIVKNVVVCYDTMWTSGSPNSTFLVGQATCARSGLKADSKIPVTSTMV